MVPKQIRATDLFEEMPGARAREASSAVPATGTRVPDSGLRQCTCAGRRRCQWRWTRRACGTRVAGCGTVDRRNPSTAEACSLAVEAATPISGRRLPNNTKNNPSREQLDAVTTKPFGAPQSMPAALAFATRLRPRGRLQPTSRRCRVVRCRWRRARSPASRAREARLVAISLQATGSVWCVGDGTFARQGSLDRRGRQAPYAGPTHHARPGDSDLITGSDANAGHTDCALRAWLLEHRADLKVGCTAAASRCTRTSSAWNDEHYHAARPRRARCR